MQDFEDRQIPDEMAAMLIRYSEILDLEEGLRQEKAGLREQLYRAMTAQGLERFRTHVGEQGYKVSRREKVEVTYDEALLAARLGDRYREILAVDTKKVRKHLDAVAPLLAPQLELVGTPTRDRVRASIESGVLSVEDFAGTFEKRVSPMVYVSRIRDREGDS
jgi:hypothetical protein